LRSRVSVGIRAIPLGLKFSDGHRPPLQESSDSSRAIDLLLLRVGWKRLAHEVAGEAADHDVLAQLGDLRFH
jgi:hypothetical protein